MSNSSGFDTELIALLYSNEPLDEALDKSNPCVFAAVIFVPVFFSIAGLNPSNPP